VKALLVVVALGIAGAAHAGPRALLDHALKSTKDARASFTQVRMDALGATTTKGALEYRKPRRMRFDWRGKFPATAWVSRDTVWFYQPGQKQVLTSRASEGGAPPALFLEESVAVLEKTYKVAEEGRNGLVLTPLRAGAFKKVTLTLDPATGWPTRLILLAADGGSTRLDFGRFTVNKGVSSARLKPSWPKGTTVVDL
jgi:outer membrane lipoprotein-sorting protein